MHILVTNDDGVTAPGLLALATEMRKLGKVTVVAPDKNWSASGHVKTMHRPLRVKQVTLADGSPALAPDGAPSDCVAMALLGLVPEKIDLVVSGINPNANIGHDVTYSGTVTAAMEAAIDQIPGIAVSLDSPGDHPCSLNYESAAHFARVVAKQVIDRETPTNLILSVNVPYLPISEIKGIQITRQGQRIYRDELIERADPRGKAYYWIGGEWPSSEPNQGSDSGALSDGYVSVTPLHLDLTDYKVKEELNQWEWE
ncbi:MAG: 5'/3'-nucleotidase SurE [Chloroflexi bacterium]|jgi:5'-nucleotidase|nr:5'/3'-nucleotidase SurE [Chloroflexota bacterium]MBT3670142.1 5'/3'-nucleotidase SurE [Chloroflexota bacterium]MBT4004011.1 5'/3'-nucleotidase SurE [Chloroflexota bacterium]MBT4306184.1 5'/3'-nucleotidase SurE [Chloroflexota bacterium]MBT4534564.1 5'/3'-nucleotidase SurE [Chloroflexota bacterium]